MIDKTIVNQRLAAIISYCTELKKLSVLPFSEFVDAKNAAASESFLRRSLEAVFDVGRHILSKTGGVELAREYRSIAKGLVIRGIVSEELGETLSKMAGYRNRLVHLYHEVQSEELHFVLNNHLDDIYDFVRQISRYLGTI
ncbi:MAG: DUF86 domain-containing protein [Bacillota bacterium]|nr:DUF86 domain-containing protein [Bacillota bacterium]